MENTYRERFGRLYDEQLALEREFKENAMETCRALFSEKKVEGHASTLGLGTSLMRKEFHNVVANIQTLFSNTLQPKRGIKPSYHYIIQDLEGLFETTHAPIYGICAYAVLSVLIDGVFARKTDISTLAGQVSTILKEEANLLLFLKHLEEPRKTEGFTNGLDARIDYKYRQYYVRHLMQNNAFEGHRWTAEDLKAFAAQLIDVTLDGCGYFEYYHPTDLNGKSKPVEVRPTLWLLETWRRNEAQIIDKAFSRCPSILPPRPWENFYEGGYYTEMSNSERLLRIDASMGGRFSQEYLKKLDQVDLGNVLKAVNSIQATPWTINKEVYAVLNHIIQTGGGTAGIPSLEPLPELPNLHGEYTAEDLKEHKKKKVERIKRENARRGKALRALAIYRIAKRFKDYERIYFPHNMDFRGRIYPITSFSPQGDDMTKGLLLFADPPVCESLEDIEWMMVQGANLAGIDKVSYEDRKAWVLENEKHILGSAADPLGYTWWAKQDEPIQFLSFCFEWAKWKEYERKNNGNPAGFRTGLVIAFDGTCSGLQHFSAIMRDEIGGEAVNLVPSGSPQDIYRVVASKVNLRLNEEARTGTLDTESTGVNKATKEEYSYTKLGTKTLAQQWLAYGVDRKVTKRSVMTVAYGSKEFGFREQILEDIIEPARKEGRGEMFVAPKQAAGYMAKLIWKSVQGVVVKAVEAMEWLQKIARLVCKEGCPVTWVTPMGLPVQQNYMEMKANFIRLRLKNQRLRLYSTSSTGNLDKKAQGQAIAPNFIHSMDAAHLQKTVLNALERGVHHFAMIHDSYGTTVSQAKLMFTAVREAFLEMYNGKDLLEDFREQMKSYVPQKQWKNLPEIPTKGTLNLQNILNSLYMFS